MNLGSQNIVVLQTGLESVFEKGYVNIYKYTYEVNLCSCQVEYSLRIMRFSAESPFNSKSPTKST